MFTRVWSMAVVGLKGVMIEVEVDLSYKLPQFDLVGLPDAAVRESKYRVRTAMANSGYVFPYARILINLAPAHIKKQGPQYDLPIALAILLASSQIKTNQMDNIVVIGELALNGCIRPVRGVLSMVLAAHEAGKTKIICPYENADEAVCPELLDVYPVKNIDEIAHIFNESPLPFKPQIAKTKIAIEKNIDYDEVVGQESTKRALLIAASGRHHCLMQGSPGCGKSMVAMRLPTILPYLAKQESIETTQIYSVANMLPPDISLMEQAPFRAPHHTISEAGLVGGGSYPRPGEISLAHHGILFLDELPEFPKRILEMLRQPLENGNITISRARETISFPSHFLLIGAMNPCPCGYYGDAVKQCNCSPAMILRYQKKLSGPLLDRFDLHVQVSRVKYEYLLKNQKSTTSTELKRKVVMARTLQETRLKPYHLSTNSQMSLKLIKKFCILSLLAQKLIERSIQHMGVTARSYQKILKISRTIADIEGSETIEEEHIAEALQYRFQEIKLFCI